MAGTVTVTISNPQAIAGSGYHENVVVTADWVASGGGAANGALATIWTAAKQSWQPTLTKIRGFVRKIETAPGLNGDLATALPTASYDITLVDAYGADIADGGLANRSGTVGEIKVPDQPIYVDSELTLNVSAAGDTKKGRIIIYLSDRV